MSLLDGKRALVCGSTQGMGKACAVDFAENGAEVTLVARDPQALESICAGLPTGANRKHRYIAADFTQPDDVRAKVESHITETGPFQVLLNNTGGPSAGGILDASPDEFLRALRMHLICNQLLVQAVVPGMRETGYGRIINIISTSVKQPIPGLGVSNTTRGAVASWAKTLAGELGPLGITVNNILPGYTATKRLEQLLSQQADKEGITIEEMKERHRKEIPLRRFADPSETAAAATFLASEKAAYITGINLPVDGGRLACL